MGILLGNSRILLNNPPLLQSGCSPFSTSPHGAACPCTHRKVARKKGGSLAIMACAQEEIGSQRRSLLFVGISVLPLMKLREVAAAENLVDGQSATEASELSERAGNPQPSISEPSQTLEEPLAGIFLSFLNAVGILGSGVLGALYAISKEDKAAMESNVVSMKSLVDAKQAAITSLEKSFELRLLKEREERQRQAKKLREEEADLFRNLTSANSTISALSQELRAEKRLLGELQMQINQLHTCLLRADEEKKELDAKVNEKISAIDILQDRVSLLSLEIQDKEASLESLNMCLADRESETMTLKSIIDEIKVELRNANSASDLLKSDIRQIKEDLNSKDSKIIELSSKIKLLAEEIDDDRQIFQHLQGEYNDFKSTSAAKAHMDSKILSQKDDELQMVERRLALVIDDAKKSHNQLEKITYERDEMRATMDKEMASMKILQQELQSARESLKAMDVEVSNLSEQLMGSQRDHERLEMEISRIQSASSEAEILMRQGLDEARSASNELYEELGSVKDVLHTTKEALYNTTDELKIALEDQAALKTELVEIYKKAASTGRELDEARSMVASLELELETTFKQLKSGNEAREALTSNLNEVMQALDEMNKTANSLSRELESTRSKATDLEMENQVLSQSLSDQKRVTLEARDNIEDAQNLLQRLVDERDNLEKKGAKLEEELALAKGEILRMRRKVAVSGQPSSEEAKQANDAEATTSSSKRNGSTHGGRRNRRHSSSSYEESE